MVNEHIGRRPGYHTGKESVPKTKTKNSASKRQNSKKFKCRNCGKRLSGSTMVECGPDRHGRVFYCHKCYGMISKNV